MNSDVKIAHRIERGHRLGEHNELKHSATVDAAALRERAAVGEHLVRLTAAVCRQQHELLARHGRRTQGALCSDESLHMSNFSVASSSYAHSTPAMLQTRKRRTALAVATASADIACMDVRRVGAVTRRAAPAGPAAPRREGTFFLLPVAAAGSAFHSGRRRVQPDGATAIVTLTDAATHFIREQNDARSAAH